MIRNPSLQKKETNKFSESINKRNYSANILVKPYDKRLKIKEQGEEISAYKQKQNMQNNKEQVMNVIYENDISKQKYNNLERFIFLNQQLKENDYRKKNMETIRKITSAEPNTLKTKLSQKIGKMLHEQPISANTRKYDHLNLYNNHKYNVYDATINLYNTKKIQNSNNYNGNNTKITLPVLNQTKVIKNSVVTTKPFVEYFVKMLQNNRETMEDFHLIEENFVQGQSIFALFDGHGGIEVAKKLKDEMASKFLKITKNGKSLDSVEIDIKSLFQNFDEEIIKIYQVNTEFESTNFKCPGSTCTFLYLIKDFSTKEVYLYSANIGDTRGVILSNSCANRITYEHKPSDEAENKRVKSNGGVIFSGKIFGQFALTRAFGNIPLKKWVIADPFIKKTIVNENDRFAVIASDGIWDVISDDECFEISIKHSSSKSLCEELVNTALSRWSKDNISCIAIRLN